MYGFCNLENPPTEIPGISGAIDPLRTHTNHPEAVALGGYSTRHTEPLGNPCDRLRERGLLDRVKVNVHEWQAVAVGNLDDDPDLEIWTIDNYKNLSRLAED